MRAPLCTVNGMHRKGRVERLPNTPDERAPWDFSGAGELAMLVGALIAPDADDDFGYVPTSGTQTPNPSSAPLPAPSPYTLELAQRVAILQHVLTANPGCAV